MKKLFYIMLIYPALVFSQGSEMITNGDLSSATGWDATAGVTISGGVASFDGTTFRILQQYDADMVSSIVANTEYTLSFDISNGVGDVYISVRATTSANIYIESTIYADDSYSIIFTAPSDIGDGGIMFRSNNAFDIDNISLIPNAIIGDDPYYVAVDGNDAASGDINNPWATFQRAINVAQAGDTVYYRDGVWYETDGGFTYDAWNGIGNNGTADNWIYHLNYPGENPIFDFSQYTPTGATQWSALGINYTTYVYFRGLTFRHISQGAAVDSISAFGVDCFGASNLTFERVVAHNVGGRGFGFFGGFGNHNPEGSEVAQAIPDVPADTLRFLYCDSYNNCDTNDVGSFVGGLADGFKANNESGAYIYFYGCRAWNNSDDGFDPNGPATIHMENCWTFSNGYFDGDGYGMKTIGLDTTSNDVQPPASPVIRKFYNNISAFNSYLGMSLGMRASYWLPSTEFYNNVVYRNPTGFVQGALHHGNDNPVIYKNNLAYDNTSSNVSNDGTYQGHHNSFEMGYPWEDSLTISASDFAVALDSATIISELTASRKSDGSLPDITVFKLAETSWMKGAGTDVGFSSTPDIGVDWDYLGAGSTPTPSRSKSLRSGGKTQLWNGKRQIISF